MSDPVSAEYSPAVKDFSSVPTVDKEEFHDFMEWYLSRYLAAIEVVPSINLVSSQRKNDKRPAAMSFFVPDSWVMNFRGEDDQRDGYLVLRVPREGVMEWKSKTENLVAAPDQLIVTP